MAVSNFNQKECSTLAYVGLAYMQCMSWCTPVLPAIDYVYLFLMKQLHPKVWISLLLSMLIVSVSVLVLCAATLESWTAADVFNLAVTIFAQRPPAKPLSTPPRIVVAIWLWAGLVLRTAYEGEMKVVSFGMHSIAPTS